jgi:hypothetical protein
MFAAAKVSIVVNRQTAAKRSDEIRTVYSSKDQKISNSKYCDNIVERGNDIQRVV